MASLTPQEVSREVSALRGAERVPQDFLKLCEDLFLAEFETQQKLRSGDLYPQVSKEEIAKRVSEGLPVIDPQKLVLDEARLFSLLEKVSLILGKHTEKTVPPPLKLLEAAKAGDVNLKELVKAFLVGDRKKLGEVATKAGLDGEEVIFVATYLIHPFLRALAPSLGREVDLEKVLTGRCPICGGAPLMAKLREEDGKRILECSLCATQWAFKRLGCPYCGNEDEGTLGFFFVEEDGFRVDKCDNCKRYIKTLDERKKASSKPRLLLIQDVATLYLDILAAREGYQSIRRWGD